MFNSLSDEDLENIFVTNQPHECTTCGTFVKVRRTNEMVNSMYAGDDIKYMRNQLTCIKCGYQEYIEHYHQECNDENNTEDYNLIEDV